MHRLIRTTAVAAAIASKQPTSPATPELRWEMVMHRMSAEEFLRLLRAGA